jgi:hypothetical protein
MFVTRRSQNSGMENGSFGLWGTADPDRVAVSVNCDEPAPVIGYVCMTTGRDWIIEGDTTKQSFATPGEAAQVGLARCFDAQWIDFD